MDGVAAVTGGARRTLLSAATLETAYIPRRAAAAEMRTDLRDFLARQAVGAGLAFEVVLAAHEAFVNAVVYAGGGLIRVSACVTPSEVSVEVRDGGEGFASGRPDRRSQPDASRSGGRGFFIMESMMDEVGVLSGRAGTTVRMVKRLA
jgi:anti-sigma regulatory factor (Ser/Thr protein kinase)